MLFGIWMTGCAHVDAPMSVEQASDDATAQVRGRVDDSELPTVEHERGFWPGPMSSAPEPHTWLSADFGGAVTHVDLRNGCRRALQYVFAPNGEQGSARFPRRSLDGYTMQTQVIPSGHWLHLYDGSRWLGAALVTVSAGIMQVSPSCEMLEVSYELRERGTTHFSIHWQLDADTRPLPSSHTLVALASEPGDAPESWAPREGEGIELRLANLCAEPLEYAFTPTLDEDPERRSTLPAHTERIVEVPPGWWLRHEARDGGDDAWRSGVTTNHAGDVLWLSANCIDHGVGDGRVVEPGHGGTNVESP
jgi:hypothetical protein